MAKPNHSVPIWKIPFSDHPGPTSIVMLSHRWQAIDCGNTSVRAQTKLTHQELPLERKVTTGVWGRGKQGSEVQVSLTGLGGGGLPKTPWAALLLTAGRVPLSWLAPSLGANKAQLCQLLLSRLTPCSPRVAKCYSAHPPSGQWGALNSFSWE